MKRSACVLGAAALLVCVFLLGCPRSTIQTETVMLPGDVPMEMVWIPGGSFVMGSPDNEQDRYTDEGPQGAVSLNGFWMAKCEVTKRQWLAVMGTAPWSGQEYVLDDLDSPAVYVSWNDAQVFLAEVSGYFGQTYRLPSEAEWEYACRAGTTTRFYWGNDPNYTAINDYAWWIENALNAGEEYAHEVGLKLPNAWGLYDMTGNVWEWCQDWYHGSYEGAPSDGSAWVSPSGEYRVLRGGSWHHLGNADYRSAYRNYDLPQETAFSFGFRVAV